MRANKKTLEGILSKGEIKILKKLSTPQKIQDFIDTIPFNFEKEGETYMSPSRALKARNMHCFEGALFATLCLTYQGFENRLVDLKVKNTKKDSDHTLCIFKQNGYWGAISKTNHSVLRFRDPIYKTARELVMTYFHEYFLNTGEKTLSSYSKPYDVFKNHGTKWINQKEDLDDIAEALDISTHIEFVPTTNKKLVRKAGKTEIEGAGVEEYK